VAHTSLSCVVELARSLSIGSAPSPRASQKSGIHEKAKENAKTVLSRLASFDNASNSTTGFTRSGVIRPESVTASRQLAEGIGTDASNRNR
jgi:hypothetical protein